MTFYPHKDLITSPKMLH